jgi:hypothetical protein
MIILKILIRLLIWPISLVGTLVFGLIKMINWAINNENEIDDDKLFRNFVRLLTLRGSK